MINENLLYYSTRAKFLQEKDQIKDEAIVFIENPREIWTHKNGFQTLPSPGEEGQVLTITDDSAEWNDNTLVKKDEYVITELVIDDSEEEDLYEPITREELQQLEDKVTSRNGCNLITDISSVPVTKVMCSATISQSSELGLDGSLQAGEELHIIINNSSSDNIIIAIPSTFKSAIDTLEVGVDSFGEINIISNGTNLYLRAL